VSTEPSEYLSEHVQDALARDPRLNELGLRITITGDKAFLSGDVATAERRDAAGAVAAELLPDHHVHNQVNVVDRSQGGGEEVVA
jgi:osmotically-inducible protein OsmY